jgi:hypothetical protein
MPPRPQDQAGIHRRLVQGIASKAVGTAIIVQRTNSARAGFLLFWSPDQYGVWLAVFSDQFLPACSAWNQTSRWLSQELFTTCFCITSSASLFVPLPNAEQVDPVSLTPQTTSFLFR